MAPKTTRPPAPRKTSRPPRRRSARPAPVRGGTETPYVAIDALLPLKAVPWLVATYDKLQRMSLDERSGFLLSFIDGRMTVEMILDVCCIERSEAIALLVNLVNRGAIALR